MLKRIYLVALITFNVSIIYAQEAEKKVDYLEKIYFSGKNKADLNDMILATVSHKGSQFDSTMLPTPAFLKQYIFLNHISSQVSIAKESCDVLDLIAVGIRQLDIDEAIAQKIKQPSPEATKNSADALAGITNVNNAISSTNNALNTLAWNNYLMSGKATGFGALGKIGGATGTLGAAASTLDVGKHAFDAVKKLGLVKSKDKPCKEVDAREIALGEHKFKPAVQPTVADVNKFNEKNSVSSSGSPTTITINNINFSQLKTLTASIQKLTGVSDVGTQGFSNNTATLTVGCTLSLMDLLADISKISAPLKLEVISIDDKEHSGVLAAK